MSTFPNRKLPGSRREAGSAYILVLVVLLVLTLLALFLALITQSEVEVGANERTINRVFYSAEAGVTASVAGFLYGNSQEGHEFTYMDPGSTVFGTHVAVAPMNQINYGPCNLCEVNQNSQYVNVTQEVSAMATRFGKDANGNEKVLARKQLELMVGIQPLQLTNPVDTFDGEKRP
jgi:Tfp pilus assembly protein PilX